MKKYASIFKNYFNNKKRLVIGILSLLIGIILLGSSIIFNNKQSKEDTFRTISYDEEATAGGQIAGAFDAAETATASPTLKAYNRTYVSPTLTAVQTRTPTAAKTTSTTSTTSSGSTGGSSTSTSNPTPTATTQPTATPIPATSTSTPIHNTSTPVPTTPTPTSPPPTPEATPTPGFGASINTSVDGDILKVTVEANRPLKTCLIHFLKDVSGADVPVSDQNPSPSDNTCNAEYDKTEVKKIKAYLSSTSGETAQIEKSGPFE